MLVRFFRVSHNTQMLGIKYAYLMIMFFDKDSFKLGKIKKLKELILKKK